MMNSLADMSAEVARQLRDRTGDTCIEVSPEEEDYSQLSFCMPLSVHTYGESGEKQANLAEQLQNAQRFMPINVPESHSADFGACGSFEKINYGLLTLHSHRIRPIYEPASKNTVFCLQTTKLAREIF
eukprot:TRINITY_DN3179_c0_g2_i7.p2 TRINITY_DN3179_c0_g2~~TRINITY_DN3179_c0_g2_i7.p2  ORF type:complete len:128 (+),score=1.37 TRINITY_DN3179_c0_g2_i7:771-1154(+)